MNGKTLKENFIAHLEKVNTGGRRQATLLYKHFYHHRVKVALKHFMDDAKMM